MTFNNFKNLCNKIGVKFEEKEVKKNNGMIKKGLVLDFGTEDNPNNLRPTIYEDMIEQIDEIKAYTQIMKCKEEANKSTVDLSDLMSNSDWVRTRLRVAIRNREMNNFDEDTVRTVCHKPFDDLEEYYYINLTDDDMKKLGCSAEWEGLASMKINTHLMKAYGYKKEWIRANARNNTRKLIKIEPMSAVLTELMGVPFDEEIPLYDEINDTLWIATVEDNHLGAAALLYDDILKAFATEHNMEVFAVIPSSIHEVLIVKVKSFDEMKNINKMIKEVNETHVAENEILGNNAYLITNE